MAQGYEAPAGGDLGELIRVLERTRRRLDQLEAPDGSQVADALATLTDLVNGLLTQVNGIFSGYVQAGGDISTTAGYFYSPAGYSFDITYTRRAAWLGNDGRLAWASSSITVKELVDSIPEPDALKILDIVSHHYERLPEIAKRDDVTSPNYIGPDYHVATEWGAIAEELHALGLWQVVIYDWEIEYELQDVLDEAGDPIANDAGEHLKARIQPGRRVGEPKPVGIHYELLGLLAIVATRHVWTEHQRLREDVRELQKKLN